MEKIQLKILRFSHLSFRLRADHLFGPCSFRFLDVKRQTSFNLALSLIPLRALDSHPLALQ